MTTLQLDGVPVTTSALSQTCYKAAPCRLLLKVTAENLDQAVQQFRDAGFAGAYSGLSISGVNDLGFLEQFPDTLYLEITGDKPIQPGALQSLRNLRGLHFESPGTGIDFSWFPELEVYSGGWHKAHANLSNCPALRRLMLRNYNPDSRDLSMLANNRRLELLDVVRSTITSLKGVETLEDLRVLDIAYMSKLESLAALKQCPELRVFSIERAKNIQSYEPLASLARLKHLRLFGCADMQNLKWTKGMNWLEHFAFVDTNVVDGDLQPLLRLERLRYVGTMDRRHYNYKMHEFNEMLANR